MLLAKNPTDARIREIIDRSAEKAAKWLRDKATGDRYFWEAERAFHRDVAEWLGVSEYTKGLAVTAEHEAAPSRSDHASSSTGQA